MSNIRPPNRATKLVHQNLILAFWRSISVCALFPKKVFPLASHVLNHLISPSTMAIIPHLQHPITPQPTTRSAPSNNYTSSTMPSSTNPANFQGCRQSVCRVLNAAITPLKSCTSIAHLWCFWAPWWPSEPSPAAATIANIHYLMAAAARLPFAHFFNRFHRDLCLEMSAFGDGFRGKFGSDNQQLKLVQTTQDYSVVFWLVCGGVWCIIWRWIST